MYVSIGTQFTCSGRFPKRALSVTASRE